MMMALFGARNAGEVPAVHAPFGPLVLGLAVGWLVTQRVFALGLALLGDACSDGRGVAGIVASSCDALIVDIVLALA
jgi:hypothetical protein